MKYDEQSAAEKRHELLDAAVGPITSMLPEEVRERILDVFSRVSPPEAPESAFTIGLITIRSFYDQPKADSRKPGNVLLNWRKLVDIVPDISLAGLGAATLPVAPAVAAVLAGLYVWNKVWRGTVEEFSDIEAVTILALWQNCNADNKISEVDGLAKTNFLRTNYSLPPLTVGQFSAAIKRLSDIACIELEDGVIWLREWIRVKYS